MRNILLKIHLYAGLLCSSYLIIFGVSALNFNHHFGRESGLKSERQRGLRALPAIADDNRLAEALRDTLGLVGWTLPWETGRRETADSLFFHFSVSRPGKQYRVEIEAAKEELAPPPEPQAPPAIGKKETPQNPAPPATKDPHKVVIPPLQEPAYRVRIEETTTGIWSIVGAMHGFNGELPRGSFMRYWAWYTEVCCWVVFFSVVSGVYLWAAKPSERLVGLILLGAGAGGGLLFMLYIWIWG